MLDVALSDIIMKLADQFIGRVNTNMRETGTDASGETSKSLHYKIMEKDGQPIIDMVGKPFFAVIETGRRPTPEKGPSASMVENIRSWTSVRGIPSEAAWAIAVDINKQGTALWRKGGRKDIYSNEIPPFVDSMAKAVTTYYAAKLLAALDDGLTEHEGQRL